MSSQFFQRVANYVANEFIVKGLANSKTFQRFAVRTNKQYEEATKQGVDHFSKTFEDIAQQQAGKQAGSVASSSIKGPPKPPLRGIPGFFSAFFKEARKDITGA
jgi:transposase